MNPYRVFTGLPLFVILLVAFLTACEKEPELDTAFKTNPMFEGWNPIGEYQFQEENTWTPPDEANSPGYITIKKGRWHAPILKVEPFQYYRLELDTRTPVDAFWAVSFYSGRAEVHPADHYSEVYASESWRSHEFVFKAEEESVGAGLYFRQQVGRALDVSRVSVEAISDQEVLDWADSLYHRLPPLNYEPPADRLTPLRSTVRKLNNGKNVRIVMLGDSLANDLSNGTPDVLLEREYPGAEVTWISSVKGGKGAWYFKKKDRLREKVVRHDPDLLIIGGVSHRNDVASFERVIENVRDEIDTDFLVMPGFIAPPKGDDWDEGRSGGVEETGDGGRMNA